MKSTEKVLERCFPGYRDMLAGVISSDPSTELRRSASYEEVLDIFPDSRMFVVHYEGDIDSLCSRLLDLIDLAFAGSFTGAGSMVEKVHSAEGAPWVVRRVSLAMMSCLLCREGLILNVGNVQRLIPLLRQAYWKTDKVPKDIVVTLIERLGLSKEENRIHFCELIEPTLKNWKEYGWTEADSERVHRLEELLWGAEISLEDKKLLRLLEGDDAWAAKLLEYLLSDQYKELVLDLLDLTREYKGRSKPTQKWLKQVDDFIVSVDKQVLENLLCEWFDLVDEIKIREPSETYSLQRESYMQMLNHCDSEYLLGMCWVASRLPSAEMARSLSKMVFSAYRHVPGIGPRAIKLGNVGVNALGVMPHEAALAELSQLKTKVEFVLAWKLISKVLDSKAAKMGVSFED